MYNSTDQQKVTSYAAMQGKESSWNDVAHLKHDALSLTIAELGFYIASRIASIFYLHLHMNRVHNINFTGKSWGSKSIIKYY